MASTILLPYWVKDPRNLDFAIPYPGGHEWQMPLCPPWKGCPNGLDHRVEEKCIDRRFHKLFENEPLGWRCETCGLTAKTYRESLGTEPK